MLEGPSLNPRRRLCASFHPSVLRQSFILFVEDDSGDTHEIRQGEGGEQGDPLMPLLWASIEPFVQSSPTSWRTNASSLSTMTSTSCCSQSALASCMLARELWAHSRIRINGGKTQIWNRGGFIPQATMPCLQSPVRMTRMPRFGLVITLHLSLNAGFVVLLSLGSHAFRANSKPLENPMSWLSRILAIQDLQSAWLFLLFCAATRFTHSVQFAHNTTLMCGNVSAVCWASHSTQLYGKSAVSLSIWAGWDCGVLLARSMLLVGAAGLIVHQHCPDHGTSPRSFLRARLGISFGLRPQQPAFDEMEPSFFSHGWQFLAGKVVEQRFRSAVRVAMHSHSASTPPFSIGSHVRASFFRRPFLFCCPLPRSTFPGASPSPTLASSPLASRTCRCGRLLDVLGHHRAACARAGVLGGRGFSVESAVVRVCREASARVSTNVFNPRLDLAVVGQDGRRLEVVADGLPLFGGAQLAIDTTLVSPIRADGCLAISAQTWMALAQAHRRKQRTCPELDATDELVWWSSPLRLVGAGRRKPVIGKGQGQVCASCLGWSGPSGLAAPLGHSFGMRECPRVRSVPVWTADLLLAPTEWFLPLQLSSQSAVTCCPQNSEGL